MLTPAMKVAGGLAKAQGGDPPGHCSVDFVDYGRSAVDPEIFRARFRPAQEAGCPENLPN